MIFNSNFMMSALTKINFIRFPKHHGAYEQARVRTAMCLYRANDDLPTTQGQIAVSAPSYWIMRCMAPSCIGKSAITYKLKNRP